MFFKKMFKGKFIFKVLDYEIRLFYSIIILYIMSHTNAFG